MASALLCRPTTESGRGTAFTALELANVGIVIVGFVAFWQQRGRYAQRRLYFLFEPGQLKLFLSQGLVNVFHASTVDISEKVAAIFPSWIPARRSGCPVAFFLSNLFLCRQSPCKPDS
jgi:hypothetical protein